MDPTGLQSVQVINEIKGPFTSTQGDITATFYIDADHSAEAGHNPDTDRFKTPHIASIGVEVGFNDAKAGQPCQREGERVWITFKRQREAYYVDFSELTELSPIPDFPLTIHANWVKDGYGGSTEVPFYDYPNRFIPNLATDDIAYTYQEYAVVIACKCGNEILEDSLSIMYYSFVARQSVNHKGPWAAVIWKDQVMSPLPDPGWAEIWFSTEDD